MEDIMCTAISFKNKDFYFGRNLDYEFSYGENIVFMPRKFNLKYSTLKNFSVHYAMMGVAHIFDNYPLFYDGFNEHGLAVAGLNFVNNAYFFKNKEDKLNVAQYELIPFILTNYKSIDELEKDLPDLNITDTPFNDKFKPSQLHYLISDKNRCIVLEQMKDGLHIYENDTGCLTNNPPFNIQRFLLNMYQGVSNENKESSFSKNLKLEQYSRGMGGISLPGDLSSPSRFIKVVFTKENSIVNSDDENESVSQFFHILNSVEQQRGCCKLDDNKYEITIYSSCYNVDKKICYYKTYDNFQINAIKMEMDKLDTDSLITYEMIDKMNINHQN